MPNIKLQDLTAMIHHSSRFNGSQFDMVHVETILQTDIPLTTNDQWYIPSGTTIPEEIFPLLKATNIAMYPMSAAYVDSEVGNIREAAKNKDLREVEHDSSLLLLQSIMTPQSFTPVTGTTNYYHLAYDYKLFQVNGIPNTYDFKVVLPFHGLGMSSGSRVQMTIILPITSILDATTTQGISINGQKIEEFKTDIPQCQRTIVNFMYQNDPEFTIRYHY
jgi:hypothetical protein